MLLIALCVFVTKPCKQKSRWLNRRHDSIGPSLRGNMWIRFIMEACLDISIAGSINLILDMESGSIPMSTPFDILNSVSLLVLYSMCLVFPFAVMGFYLYHFMRWKDNDFE